MYRADAKVGSEIARINILDLVRELVVVIAGLEYQLRSKDVLVHPEVESAGAFGADGSDVEFCDVGCVGGL